METLDAIQKRRTIRKFTQTPIPKETLLMLADAARMAAYPANLQPLRFAIVDREELLPEVFACTKWAGYLADGTPKEGERPTAYLIFLGDCEIKKSGDFGVETGAAGATVTLAATAAGIASCWIGSLNRERLAEILNLPSHLKVLDLIALGYPAQESVAVPMENGDVKYYLKEDVLRVPKRSLSEVLYEL